MATGQLDLVVHRIKRLVLAPATRQVTDAELLKRYWTQRDEAAFAALVQRHGRLVLGVCRHVLRQEQDAEDSFQATFILLAHKAGSIRKGQSVASWLYGVAHRMSKNAQRKTLRRRTYEHRAAIQQLASRERQRPEHCPEMGSLNDLQIVLDEEVNALPTHYRAPFVLCCLEGKTRTETARELGWKEGTVAGRLAKARTHLQRRLTRRGVTLSAALTAGGLSQPATGAVPAVLAATTVKAALSYAAGETTAGVLSASVTALVRGASKAALLVKVKVATVILVTAGVIAAGAVKYSAVGAQDAKPPAKEASTAPQKQTNQAKESPNPRPGRALEEQGDTITVAGRVLGPDGKPFEGADLLVWVKENYVKAIPPRIRARSDPEGYFRFSFAKAEIVAIEEPIPNWEEHPWHNAVVVAATKGLGADWKRITEIGEGPLTLTLRKDDVPVKGRIRDLQGRPVAGASIELKRIDSLYRPTWAGAPGKVVSDNDGRFIMTGIGNNRAAELRIVHPSIELKVIGVNTEKRKDGQPAAGGTVDILAGPTKPIEGTIRGKDTGKPLPGVLVLAKYRDLQILNLDYHGAQAVTDEKGRYRLLGLGKAKEYELTVLPKPALGYMQTTKRVKDTQGLKPIDFDFDLTRGIRVRFRLVDKESKQPVRGIAQYAPFIDNSYYSEANALEPATVLPRIFVHGQFPDKDCFFNFVVYPGPGVIYTNSGHSTSYLRARLDPADEVNGHSPGPKGDHLNDFLSVVSGYRRVDSTKTQEILEFEIPLDPGRTIKGSLIGPDKNPVVGASAFGLSAAGTPTQRVRTGSVVLKTESFTAMSLDDRSPATVSFIHHDRKLVGYAVLGGNEAKPVKVRMQPWGTVTGRLLDGAGKPVCDVRLTLVCPSLPAPGIQMVKNFFETDQQGRFRVDGLVPGVKHELALSSSSKRDISFSAGEALRHLSTQAGERKELGDIRVLAVPVKKEKANGQ